MSKRPPSPSNIPVPKNVGEPGSPSQKSRTPRQLPQAIVAAIAPSSREVPGIESKLPTPAFVKRPKTPSRGKQTSDSEQPINIKDNKNDPVEESTPKNGVIYITDNLIRKMSKEDNFYRVFKLDLTLPKDLKKKIKYIENLDSLKNLQILSIAHNSIAKMEQLSKLVNLQILDLSDNQIQKIEGIELLQQLSVLNLEQNRIKMLPTFISKKLKCLRTFKIARNQINSLHELYKLRTLPDLVELSIQGNPMCTLEHHSQLANFLLRSLEILDGELVTVEERREADERFSQEEVCYLENELNHLEKRLAEVEAEREKANEFGQITKQSEIQLKKKTGDLKQTLTTLEKNIEMKNNLLESKTKELSKACEKQFKLEQELAFYKLDTKFDELWKFPGYQKEDSEDEYIDEDQSAYIGKARFKPNSYTKELFLPSKAQILNLIKLTKQDSKESTQVNQTIVQDLEEALNVDLQQKQTAIGEAENKLEKLKVEIENNKNKVRDMNENYFLPTEQIDGASPLTKMADREHFRAKLVELINQAKEMQATVEELKDKLSATQQTLNKRETELEKLKEEKNEILPDNPKHEKIMDEIAAKEEQCFQINDFLEQLSNLLEESQLELEEKTETIRALEMELKLGEPDVQSEMKQGLEDLVRNLTSHLEELKGQMKEQKSVIADLEKERAFLQRKIEQLEADVIQGDALAGDVDDISARLREKENALQDEIDNNQKICEAYEDLLKKVNKKKRHVGIGSHDVWRDPALEILEAQVKDSQEESEQLHQALERVNNQRDAERRAFEEKLEQGQAELEDAVMSARAAGDFEKEAFELNQQVQKLKAERAGLKQRVNSLEEDLNKEKEDSVPWNQILRQLKSISDELDGGEISRQSPSMGTSLQDKKLQRHFEDLRDKINGNVEKNEEEKNAIVRQLEKAEVEQLAEQLAESNKQCSKANMLCREAEQEAEDAKQMLKQTEDRLRKALQETSNNAAAVEEELVALQNQLEDSKRNAAQLRKENDLILTEVEELQARLAAEEQHSKETEEDLQAVNGKLKDAKESLKDHLSKTKSKMKKIEEENERLNDALRNLQSFLDKANSDATAMQSRLRAAEARMRQAENKAKELEFQLEANKSNEKILQDAMDSLRDKLQKQKSRLKDEMNAERKRAAKIEQEFSDEIQFLNQQAKEDRKLIDFLKNELKKDREDHKNEVDFLSEENTQLQEDLLQQQLQLQKAEDNNNRLLETIARLEDENDALNDFCNQLQKEAVEALENEKSLHEKELKGLQADIEELERQYENKANNDGRALLDSVSRDIDDLKKKINTADREHQNRMEESHQAKKRLQDENLSLRHRLEKEIKSANSQISELMRALTDRESDFAALRNSADPLIVEYRNRIGHLLVQLQIKNDELNGLMQKFEDLRKTSGFGLHALSNELESMQNSLSKIARNSADILSSKYREHVEMMQPQRLKTPVPFYGSTDPCFTLPNAPASSSPVHHYYHDMERNLGPFITSSSHTNGKVHIHHHHNMKKKKKNTYRGDFCNVPEHEDMSDQMASLEDRLKDATLSKSRISDDSSPLKLELKHLESKVDDAILMRTRRRLIGRSIKNMTY